MSAMGSLDETDRPLAYDRPDRVVIALIMGLMGAFFWAIRGTSGFGGSAGGTLAGLGWALLWLGFSHLRRDGALRPYGSDRMVAAIALGIAFGGMTGYGVYISWLNGVYQMKGNEVTCAIAPWTGYAMLFVCGIHWGGVTGSFMAWAAPQRPMTWPLWGCRIAAGIVGAGLAMLLVKCCPGLFLPYYSEGYYQVAAYTSSARAMRSILTIAQHVGVFAGFLGFELARRDGRAVKIMLTMALGFALPFAIGGYWQTMHGSELRLDWWKNWEMTIGLGGGLAFGLAFSFFNRPELASMRPARRMERMLCVGLVVWLMLGTVLPGAYDGFINVRGLTVSLASTRTMLSWVCRGVAAVIFILWVCRGITTSKRRQTDPHRPLLPLAVIAGLLAVIVCAGYVTSIPLEIALANKVLLTLYTFYITTSLVLFAVLWRRQTGYGGAAMLMDSESTVTPGSCGLR